MPVAAAIIFLAGPSGVTIRGAMLLADGGQPAENSLNHFEQ